MKRWLQRIFLYFLQITFVLPVLYLYSGIRYRRRHRMPKGPCLVVANHNSHLDAAVLMHTFPLRRIANVHPVAAADYFGASLIKRILAHGLMNAIPIDRKPKPGEDPLRRIKVALKRGKSLIFFPEGSRGEAGVVAPFRSGVGRLVKEMPGLLVVPVFVSGAERIWPRGKAVPVPLGIDVNIGRPKTYDAHKSSREIANEIREDVLALAPPPPPVPGPRPQPPKRVAVCGIDGVETMNLRRAITAEFGKTQRTLGIGNPSWKADEEGIREIESPIPTVRSRFWLRVIGAMFRRTVGTRESFTEYVERGAVDEALQNGREAEILVGGGGSLVDLLAHAHADIDDEKLTDEEFHKLLRMLTGTRTVTWQESWRAFRNSPAVFMINLFDLVRLPQPDHVVFVRSSPESCMRHLRSQGIALDERENEEYLAKLQAGYERVLDLLEKRYRVQVLMTSGEESSAVAKRVVEQWGEPQVTTSIS